MRTLIKYYCLLFFVATGIGSPAQMPDYPSAKEKIYIHTNHVFFKPGESLYFKIYLINAQAQTPSQ
ncbi:MAG TPA: hypothetical protein VI461_09460, partial [Chitinophagaceae bacterium]|nr:hypothetical protein [Chitinophagaceae bacterium]